ncbi:MAG: Bax inhibitor-1/YccA family protein [Bacteroidales bacterium]
MFQEKEEVLFSSVGRERSMAKTFMANVFSWMFIALAITGTVSYYFAKEPSLISLLFNPETGGMSILGWIVMLAPLGFVFLMSLGFNKLSYPVITALYIVYSILMGMSLSFIFLAYTASSIYSAFGVSALTFGVMAIMGYTTKTDLTKFGSILTMALIGLVVAMLINFFLQSSAMGYIISIAGVLIFTGLVAYDVQKLKRIGAGAEYGTETTNKLVILGALTLYLDFVNLFLFLLRLFGGRK